MNFILDTNIVIHTLRNPQFLENLDMEFQLFQSDNITLISSVSVGELYSFAKRNRWGQKRWSALTDLLKKLTVYPIGSEDIYESYAEIDTFSQGKLDYLPLGRSAINMGKNDLWIAATTAVFQGTLLTTDKDFTHLNNIFIKVISV